MKHTFAISAYGKSMYLEECIKSLLRQSVVSDIIMCTSTDNSYIRGLADKYKINMRRAKRMFDDWMKTDYAFTNSLQLHYRDIKRKIIAEKYLETNLGELQDYKFLCFDGKPCFCWVDLGRYSKHTRTVFDMNWKLQPWTQASYGIANYDIPMPKNFDMMIDIANILSKGFSHVRVDLYNIDGKIYFGEMTFTNGSGLDPIIPKEYDKVLGDYWKLPKNKDGKTKND